MDIRDERRDVTALFADLVGSTALGERLDPEELKLVVGDAVARMVMAVEAFGGTVKDLAGDGVLALFGAPTAHEDDAERAVRAGLRIVDDIATFGREVAEGWGVDALNVRIGINTGPVITGAIGAGDRVEFAALGDAVNVAARLQSHAHPGSVLVGQATQQVVVDRFAWSADRAFELKGKSEPVTAFTVEGVADGTRVRTDPGVEPRMIGRDLELARLRTAVEGVAAGAGGVVFVTGEPGIGKTRMVHELRRAFGAETPEHGRALWLEGRCVSYGGSIPYWPFRDLLRSWLGVGDDEPELRVRVALRRQVDRLTGAASGRARPVPVRPARALPGARGGRAARRALTGGAAVPNVRGRQGDAPPTRGGRPRRRRARGSALGRRDLDPAAAGADRATPRPAPCSSCARSVRSATTARGG